jgi:hypothetical protein
MVPPSSGIEVAKKPNRTERIMITNKSQNQIFFSFLNEISKAKNAPVKKINLTNRKEEIPNPL